MGIAGGVGHVEHAGRRLALVVADGERAGGGGVGEGLAADHGGVVRHLAYLANGRCDDVGVRQLTAARAVSAGVRTGAGLP